MTEMVVERPMSYDIKEKTVRLVTGASFKPEPPPIASSILHRQTPQQKSAKIFLAFPSRLSIHGSVHRLPPKGVCRRCGPPFSFIHFLGYPLPFLVHRDAKGSNDLPQESRGIFASRTVRAFGVTCGAIRGPSCMLRDGARLRTLVTHSQPTGATFWDGSVGTGLACAARAPFHPASLLSVVV